jgi:putative DNA methylase
VSGRKKLIEVALPLEAINREAAREKSIRHGHPSTLHLWWARRPLAACRAVLWASLVDDPSSHPDRFPTEEAQETERQRLFRVLEQLVLWENSTNERVLAEARTEILNSTDGHPPPVYDPFCGGGSIPLEAQRLGLEAHASDLNPVAVLITKALIEIPPKFAARPPVHPDQDRTLLDRTWKGAQGLAEDLRYYGRWMRDEAFRRIGHLYPKVMLPKEQGGGEATVIAWLWARTVRCPNPACGAQMPLVRSFALSTKAGREARVEPIVDRAAKTVRFEVATGDGKPREGTVDRRGARCIVCDTAVPLEHVRQEGRAGRMGAGLMAIVAVRDRKRIYLPPLEAHETLAKIDPPIDAPRTALPEKALGFRVQAYGFTRHRDLFTARQLVTLVTLTDLVKQVRNRVIEDVAGLIENRDDEPLGNGKSASISYSDALATYLAICVSKELAFSTTLARWRPGEGKSAPAFGRQTISMVWDYAEVNPFAGAGGDFDGILAAAAGLLDSLPASSSGTVDQLDAASLELSRQKALIVTDPPYYDNIGYGDLSDYFYTWMRRSLGDIWRDLFSTLLVPKELEIVASPGRLAGDKEKTGRDFEDRLRQAFEQIGLAQDSGYPVSVFYAFRQTETEDEEGEGVVRIASTGWETMLEGLVQSKFSVIGTWPIRTEGATRMRAGGSNVLASSIVLVCRPRGNGAPLATRKELLATLRRKLPEALRRLQRTNIAPVDLAQAAIGPGMAVYSSYSKVIEADGSRLSVRTALQLINQVLDEVLAEQDSEFDADTRWALAWFDQYGMEEGPYGDAEVLSKAKDTSIHGLEDSGALEARRGRVRLLRREELSSAWDPSDDRRLTVWEVAQHLILRLEQHGEAGAAALLARLGALGEIARDLAYRLYIVCERRGWAKEAISYNALVLAWPEISRLAQAGQAAMQPQLFQ